MAKFFVSFLVVLVIGTSFSSHAYRRATSCRTTELKLRNCSLEAFGYRFHFQDDKVLLHNGIWRGIEDFPHKEKNVEWSEIKIQNLLGRRFISYQVWGEPQGVAKVQSLYWSIQEVEGVKLKTRLHHVIQKRQPDFDQEGSVAYQFDKKDHFGLKVVKGKILWFYKGDSGWLK